MSYYEEDPYKPLFKPGNLVKHKEALNDDPWEVQDSCFSLRLDQFNYTLAPYDHPDLRLAHCLESNLVLHDDSPTSAKSVAKLLV